MPRDTKILQSILDSQVSIKQEMKKGFAGVNQKMDKMEIKLTKRIDKIGLQVARLEDDAPTIEEFDNLEKRVVKLEHPQFTSS